MIRRCLQRRAGAALVAVLTLGGSRTATAQGEPVMRAHFIDVGQGAATLLEFPCGAVLIDTGSEESGWFSKKFSGSKRLLDYLDAFFARRTDLGHSLELLLITHPHIDHTRTIPALLAKAGITIRGVVTNGRPKGSSGSAEQKLLVEYAEDHHLRLRELYFGQAADASAQTDAAIDPLACSPVDPRLRVLWGQIGTDPGWGVDPYDGERHFADQNNHSLVVRVDFGAASLLITGDLEKPAIDSLVDRYAATGLLDVDVYQVGHHGSSNGTTPGLLNAISPKAAVLAAGASCRRGTYTAYAHGHPRKIIVRKVADAVSLSRPEPITVDVATAPKTFEQLTLEKRLYSTGWDGTIVITARADGWLEFETAGGGVCP